CALGAGSGIIAPFGSPDHTSVPYSYFLPAPFPRIYFRPPKVSRTANNLLRQAVQNVSLKRKSGFSLYHDSLLYVHPSPDRQSSTHENLSDLPSNLKTAVLGLPENQ